MRYYSSNNPGDQIRGFFVSGGAPVTLTVLALNIVTFLASFFSPAFLGPWINATVTFNAQLALHFPWTFFTYPLVTQTFSIWMIVNLVFFWISGGSLERSWGSRRFGLFFFVLSAVSALSLLIGGVLRHNPVIGLADLFLPLTGAIVAFCMINPTQTLSLYFIPVQARWVALLVTGFVFFTYGEQFRDPVMGLFACGGILAATLYVQYGRSWADVGAYQPRQRGPDLRLYPRAKPTKQPRTMLDGSIRRSPFDLAGKWKDYRERQRLERLLRNSGFTDKEPGWRDDEEHRHR